MIRKRFYLAFLLIAYFTAAYIIMWKTGITCVFLHFTGIPCPGCGMTRAFLSVIRLDFLGALRYNPLIFCMPYVFAYIFFEFKNKKMHKRILTVIGIIAVIHWLYQVVKILI